MILLWRNGKEKKIEIAKIIIRKEEARRIVNIISIIMIIIIITLWIISIKE